MFFVVSKALGAVFEPVTFLLLVGLLGLGLSWTPYRRIGARMASIAAVIFAVLCFTPVGSLMVRPLEDRFPRPMDVPAPAGIIVLGGAMDADISLARGAPTFSEAGSRLTAGVALSRKYPQARLIFTGGTGNFRQGSVDEARGVRDVWRSLGVPDDRMMFEDKSRNTFENATMTRALVGPKPGETWLLVTSAWHMPRSMGIFRRTGWSVVAYPVDYRTFGDGRDDWPSVMVLQNLTKVEIALHEWIGLVAYWLSGKTNALFPAP